MPVSAKWNDEIVGDLDIVIERIAFCESGWQDRIKVLDVNNKYSYGYLQFQFWTFMNQGKKYGILPDEFTIKEAELLIYNRNVQVAIAKEILSSKDGWRHWYNCSKKLGIDRRSLLAARDG